MHLSKGHDVLLAESPEWAGLFPVASGGTGPGP
jgi:hypothetical protein